MILKYLTCDFWTLGFGNAEGVYTYYVLVTFFKNIFLLWGPNKQELLSSNDPQTTQA